jgi:two-component system, OmpR family, response regulator
VTNRQGLGREPIVEDAVRLRILVVEDDPTMRHLMFKIFDRQGFLCEVVEDGRRAVELWEQESFDFIFMDVQMPVMDGLEATRTIRGKEALRGGHSVIIATTAFALDRDRKRCLEAGMDEYLAKPLDVERLLFLVDKYRPG